MEIIVKYSGAFVDLLSEAAQLGTLRAENLGQGYAIVDWDGAADQLYTVPAIEDIEMPREIFLNDDGLSGNCNESAVFRAQRFSGKGVLVGIIDTGVDYTSSEFRTADGKSRIAALWDQTAAGTAPEGFLSGAEYVQEQINEALLSGNPFSYIARTDASGHGTAVAGIAAGSTLGRAYQSELIVVRVSRSSTEQTLTTSLMRGVRYVIDTARRLRKPVAVNISYGMNEGSHRGDSLFERYLTAVAGEWKTTITVALGNEASAGHHYSGFMRSGEVQSIPFFTAALNGSFYLSIWKNYTDRLSAELLLPDGSSTGVINRFSSRTSIRAGELFVTAFYGQPTQRSVFQEIFFDIRPLEGRIPAALWTLRLTAEEIVSGRVDVWLPTTEQVTTATRFVNPDEELTMTIPSTADRILRVGGYDRRTDAIASFSGKGISCPEGIYPDVAASAVDVPAPTLSGGIGSFTGTSFAAPQVTGLAAQLMEWGIVCGNAPFMYGEKVKAEIRLLARRSRSIPYPDIAYGYGLI